MINNLANNQSGMSALLTIVIIGAASLVMAKSMSFLSLTELQMGDKENTGQKYLYDAEACIEDALNQVRVDNFYATSSESLVINNINCQYSVGIDGSNRDISASSSNPDYVRTINVVAEILDNQVDIRSYNIAE